VGDQAPRARAHVHDPRGGTESRYHRRDPMQPLRTHNTGPRNAHVV